jgi:hypothetical protein
MFLFKYDIESTLRMYLIQHKAERSPKDEFYHEEAAWGPIRFPVVSVLETIVCWSSAHPPEGTLGLSEFETYLEV